MIRKHNKIKNNNKSKLMNLSNNTKNNNINININNVNINCMNRRNKINHRNHKNGEIMKPYKINKETNGIVCNILIIFYLFNLIIIKSYLIDLFRLVQSIHPEIK